MPLTTDESNQVIAAAQAHATANGWRITVAIVDEGGLLKALSRMDGAPPLSAQIAESKAVGAALWHREGDSLVELEKSRPAFFSVRRPAGPAADPAGARLGADPPGRRRAGRGRLQRRHPGPGQGMRRGGPCRHRPVSAGEATVRT